MSETDDPEFEEAIHDLDFSEFSSSLEPFTYRHLVFHVLTFRVVKWSEHRLDDLMRDEMFQRVVREKLTSLAPIPSPLYKLHETGVSHFEFFGFDSVKEVLGAVSYVSHKTVRRNAERIADKWAHVEEDSGWEIQPTRSYETGREYFENCTRDAYDFLRQWQYNVFEKVTEPPPLPEDDSAEEEEYPENTDWTEPEPLPEDFDAPEQ